MVSEKAESFIVKPVIQQFNNQYILYDNHLSGKVRPEWFDATSWAEYEPISSERGGRGQAWFVANAELAAVLRHYRRGGLVARITDDRYVWTGLEHSRAWREWKLLATMRDMELPVPEPLAARVIRNGLLYTADIITRRLSQTHTLVDELSQQAMSAEHWSRLGGVIRRFHDNGIYHADLNANNILLDASHDFYLIDFDRGCQRHPQRHWQQENMKRLERSLLKITGLIAQFYFTEQDWQALVQGYAGV